MRYFILEAGVLKWYAGNPAEKKENVELGQINMFEKICIARPEKSSIDGDLRFAIGMKKEGTDEACKEVNVLENSLFFFFVFVFSSSSQTSLRSACSCYNYSSNFLFSCFLIIPYPILLFPYYLILFFFYFHLDE
jgi:hypothetical protein